MLRYRFLLPPALLIGLSVAVELLLVEMTMAMVAPLSSLRMRITLCVIAAIITTVVATLGVHWLVVAPLRRILRMIYRLTDGDFAARTETRGIGMTANVMQALDDLAGRLEARCEAARVSERRYRLLYENSPAGLFRTRLDGRVVDCNLAAVRMLGYDSVLDAKTRNARTFYANPLEREGILDRLAREGAITALLLELRRKDGRTIPVLLTVHRTRETDGTYLEGQFIDAGGLGLEASGGREDCAQGPLATTAATAGRRG
jgi:PAS domain S-box-containing protein